MGSNAPSKDSAGIETAFAPLIARKLAQLQRRRAGCVLALVGVVLYCLYAFSSAVRAAPAEEIVTLTGLDLAPAGLGGWIERAADYVDAQALIQTAPVLLLGPLLLKELKDIDFQLLHLEIARIYAAAGDPRWRDHFQDARRRRDEERFNPLQAIGNLLN